MQRAYVLHMLQEVESVAEHSQRVTVIAYLLAKEIGADPLKVLIMAAFHDLPESRTGDANWHQKEYITQNEEKAQEEQFALMGKASNEVRALLKEYHERKTLESQIAKDADNIDYLLTLKELELQGNEEAKRRLYSEDTSKSHLYTDKAKEIFDDIINSKPNEWYQKNREKTHKKYIADSSDKSK
ncbi:TPA: phosphohydrolase [Patescibacteria group bacterium]|nr:phosphohydrolase [Patescibacteria group bacterium]